MVKKQFDRHDQDTPFVAEVGFLDYWANNGDGTYAVLDLANDYVQLLSRNEVVTLGYVDRSELWERLVGLYKLTEYMEDPVSSNLVMDELMATLRVGMPSMAAIIHSTFHGLAIPEEWRDWPLRRVVLDHIVEHGELPGPPDMPGYYHCDTESVLLFWKELAHALVAGRKAPAERAGLDADGVDRRYYVST